MNLSKKTIVATSLSLILCTSLLANEVYTLEEGSLESAIKKISKMSNMTYMGDTRILAGKNIPSIKNITGLDNALKEVLKGTQLEAIIKDNTIVIKKKKMSSNSSALGDVDVVALNDETSEKSQLYIVNSANSATKMDLSFLETPQSVSIITNERMNDFSLATLDNVLNDITGVTVEEREANRSQFTSRGFDVTNIQVDGLGMPLDLGYSLGGIETVIYDRIEVTKGATALSSGAGDPSATINLITKRPTSDFQASIDLTAGSFSKKRATADVSGSISHDNKVRGRAIISHENGGSNLDRYDYNNNLFYGVVEADISDNTSFVGGVSIYENKTEDIPFGGLPYHYSNGELTKYDVSKNPAANWSYWDTIKKEIFLEAKHVFSNNWKIHGSYKHRQHDEDSDLSYISGKPVQGSEIGVSSLRTDYSFNMKENLLDVNAKGLYRLFNKDHQAVFGLSLAKNDIQKSTQRASESISNFAEGDGNYPLTDISGGAAYKGDFTNTQTALYTSTNFQINDSLSLLLGGRISNWETKGINNNKDNSKKDSNIFTPYAGLVYKITENISTYTSYTTTFNPQGYVDSSLNQLDPTEGVNYEIGTKASLFDGKVQASAALFKIEETNSAEKGSIINGIQTYDSVDGIESQGFELEIAGELTDGLQVATGFTQLKIEDHEGKDAKEYIPGKALNLSASYRLQSHPALKVGASINWQEETKRAYTGIYKDVVQDSYTLVNIMANYKFNKNLEASLNINNITNKQYYASLKNSQGIYGTPREAYINLKWKF